MVLRVFQFILGAALAGGGGWLAWTHRDAFGSLLPPGSDGLPLMLLAGVFGVTTGVVFLVSALHPRPNQRRALAARAARDTAALQEAETYYSERARAADRDWRSGDVTPLPEPIAPAAPKAPEQPASPVVAPPVPLPAAAQTVVPPAPTASPSIAAAPPSVPVAPAAPAATKPVAQTGAPVFPADATLSPIPRAQEPPPAAARPQPPSVPVAASADDPHASIRSALASGQLDEAEKLLNGARESATGVELAQLTALAGDHAIASGRQSHAKWLWRLALKRFGEHDAMNTPAARAVAESLRVTG